MSMLENLGRNKDAPRKIKTKIIVPAEFNALFLYLYIHKSK